MSSGYNPKVHGSYVDEVVAYTVSYGATTSRYYVSSNHLYSPAAITDSSGVVVERMKYDAYGRQTILSPGGTPPRTRSSVGFDRGFTGYIKDEETGLLHARARQYSPVNGIFANRDDLNRYGNRPIFPAMGYVDSLSLYRPKFIPNDLDPSGLSVCCKTILWGHHDSEGFSSEAACVGDWYDNHRWQDLGITIAESATGYIIGGRIGNRVLGAVIGGGTSQLFSWIQSTLSPCTRYCDGRDIRQVTLRKHYIHVPGGSGEYCGQKYDYPGQIIETVREECPSPYFPWSGTVK